MPATLEPSTAAALERLRTYRDGLYQQGVVRTESGRVLNLHPTGITRRRGEALRDLIGTPALRTIETGFALGLSSLYLMEAALAGGVIPDHTAIDPNQSTDWANAGRLNTRLAGMERHIRVLEAESAVVLPGLLTTGEVFDAAFIDGSHNYDGVFIDIYYLLRLVKPGGVLVLDDLWMPAVQKGIAFFERNCGVEVSMHAGENGKDRLAAIRVPARPAPRAWDHFVDF